MKNRLSACARRAGNPSADKFRLLRPLPRRATSTTTVAFAPISPSSARIQTSLCSSHHHRSDLNFDITRLTRSIPSTKLRTFRPAFFPAAPAFSRTFATASVRRPTAHVVHMRTAAHRPRTRTRHQDSSDTFLPTATPPAAARYPASLLTTPAGAYAHHY